MKSSPAKRCPRSIMRLSRSYEIRRAEWRCSASRRRCTMKYDLLATASTFSLNLWNDFQAMWQYDFMRHAFEAGTVVAIVAGVIGYFVVMRRLSFAAHALSHVGFAGAAGAVLLGWSPIIGLLAFTSGGSLA